MWSKEVNGTIDGATPDIQRSDGGPWSSVLQAAIGEPASLDPGWIDSEPVIRNGFGGIATGLAVAPKDSNIVVFTNKAGVYLTTGGGLPGCFRSLLGVKGPNWAQVYTHKVSAGTSPYVGLWRSVGMEVTTAWRYQILKLANQEIHFICYTDIGLARSTDGDVWSWSALQTGAGGDFLNYYELATHGAAIFAASGPHDLPNRLLNGSSLQTGGGAVLVTSDNGATWTNAQPAFTGNAVVSIIEAPSGPAGAAQIWISSMVTGVFFLDEAKATWTKASPPVTASANFYRLQVQGNQLFCVIVGDPSGQRGELWRGTIVPGTGVTWDAKPLTESLAPGKAIFPIDFAIDAGGNILLCVANASGGFNVIPPDAYFLAAGSNVWVPQSIPFNQAYGDPAGARPFAPFFAQDGTMYVTSLGHGTYQKTNTGWSEAFKAFPFLSTHRLTFAPEATFLTTFGAGAWRA